MKRYSSRLLALVLVLGLLAGCGSGEAAPEAPAETPAPSDTPSPSPSPTAEPEFHPAILRDGDEELRRSYTLMAVNPAAAFSDENGEALENVFINAAGGAALMQWLLSEEAMSLMGSFGAAEYGENIFYPRADAPAFTGEIPPADRETALIRLAADAELSESGLLGSVLPVFEARYGYTVEVRSAPSITAAGAAGRGEADVLFLGDRRVEEAFAADDFSYTLEGFESERLTCLDSFYVLCGPENDPAGVKTAPDVRLAFGAIAEGEYPFVSAGGSGALRDTELLMWPAELGLTEDTVPDGCGWYITAPEDPAAKADELDGYLLMDKTAFLSSRTALPGSF